MKCGRLNGASSQWNFYFNQLASMSLSKHLQTSILPRINGKNANELKQLILECGGRWYAENPDEETLITENLTSLGIPCTQGRIASIKEHILLHYFEKMLPLIYSAQHYHAFLSANIDTSDFLDKLSVVRENGRGILLATAHFGGVELIGPCIATRKIPVNAVLKFSTEQMSRSSNELADTYFQSGLFGPMKFIELGRPQTHGALDMAAALRRNEALLAVFDEKTDYSIPVTLFNRKFWGGAGLNKLIAFTQRNIALYTVFMLRQNGGRYKLILHEIDSTGDNAVQKLYDSLADLLSEHLEQWYFLHEELPFADV